MGRARQDRAIAYLPPKIPTLDASAMIASAFTYASTVVLLPGIHTALLPTIVPDDKVITGDPAAVLTLASNSTSEDTIIVGNRSEVHGFKIDANLFVREAAGFATGSIGVRGTSVSGWKCHGMTIVNCGETIAFSANQAAAGILIERGLSATSDVTGVEIYNNDIQDPLYRLPFGIRARADFTEGRNKGDQGFYLRGVRIYDNLITGTNKNVIEAVSPDTIEGFVYRNRSINAGGQGGIETDFGANGFHFYDNIVEHVGRNGIMTMDFDAFSSRCGVYTSTGHAGVSPMGNTFTNNILRDSVQVGAYFLRHSRDYGATSSVWISPVMTGVTKASGASAGRISGYNISAEKRAVTGSVITSPSLDGAENPINISNDANGFSGLTFNMSAAQIAAAQAAFPSLVGSGNVFNAI